MPIKDDGYGNYIVTDYDDKEVRRTSNYSDAIEAQKQYSPDIHQQFNEATSGCIAELIKIPFTIAFSIIGNIFKTIFMYKWSLVIWPLILIPTVVAVVSGHNYGAAIGNIIVGIIITYIAKWINNLVLWIQKRRISRRK